MKEKYVYLAGPIRGLSYAQTVAWRDTVEEELKHVGITTLSPMRYKERLKGIDNLQCHEYGEGDPLTTMDGIFARDHFDVKRSDLILVNFISMNEVSVGTIMEIAWAYEMQKPVVLMIDKESNLLNHPFIINTCPFIVFSLEDGIAVTKEIL